MPTPGAAGPAGDLGSVHPALGGRDGLWVFRQPEEGEPTYGSITYRGGTSGGAGGASAASAAITLPAGWQPGDMAVYLVRVSTTGQTFSQSAGTGAWVIDQQGSFASGGTSWMTAHRVLGSGDTAPTFAWQTAARWAWAGCALYSARGLPLAIDTYAPGDPALSASAGSTLLPDAATAQGLGEASVLLISGRSAAANTAISHLFQPPAGWSWADGDSGFEGNQGLNARFAGAAYRLNVSGTVQPPLATLADSGGDTFWMTAHHVLIAEHPQADPPPPQRYWRAFDTALLLRPQRPQPAIPQRGAGAAGPAPVGPPVRQYPARWWPRSRPPQSALPVTPPPSLFVHQDLAAVQMTSSVTTVSVTLTRPVHAGDLLVAFTGAPTGSTFPADISDSSGNTWLAGSTVNHATLLYCLAALDSPGGLTVTVAHTGQSGTRFLAVERFSVSGAVQLFGSVLASTASGTSGSTSTATGVPAGSLLVMGIHADNGNARFADGSSNGVPGIIGAEAFNGSGSGMIQYVTAAAGGSEAMSWLSAVSLSSSPGQALAVFSVQIPLPAAGQRKGFPFTQLMRRWMQPQPVPAQAAAAAAPLAAPPRPRRPLLLPVRGRLQQPPRVPQPPPPAMPRRRPLVPRHWQPEHRPPQQVGAGGQPMPQASARPSRLPWVKRRQPVYQPAPPQAGTGAGPQQRLLTPSRQARLWRPLRSRMVMPAVPQVGAGAGPVPVPVGRPRRLPWPRPRPLPAQLPAAPAAAAPAPLAPPAARPRRVPWLPGRRIAQGPVPPLPAAPAASQPRRRPWVSRRQPRHLPGIPQIGAGGQPIPAASARPRRLPWVRPRQPVAQPAPAQFGPGAGPSRPAAPPHRQVFRWWPLRSAIRSAVPPQAGAGGHPMPQQGPRHRLRYLRKPSRSYFPPPSPTNTPGTAVPAPVAARPRRLPWVRYRNPTSVVPGPTVAPAIAAPPGVQRPRRLILPRRATPPQPVPWRQPGAAQPHQRRLGRWRPGPPRRPQQVPYSQEVYQPLPAPGMPRRRPLPWPLPRRAAAALRQPAPLPAPASAVNRRFTWVRPRRPSAGLPKVPPAALPPTAQRPRRLPWRPRRSPVYPYAPPKPPPPAPPAPIGPRPRRWLPSGWLRRLWPSQPPPPKQVPPSDQLFGLAALPAHSWWAALPAAAAPFAAGPPSPSGMGALAPHGRWGALPPHGGSMPGSPHG